MEVQGSNLDFECGSPEIAAYVDGELSPDRELALDLHIAECASCRSELNSQKQFLSILDSTLAADDQLELPDDFARVVATNAESSVNGLRQRSEWLNAVAICAGLFVFCLFALGADASRSFGYPLAMFERSVAVAEFAAHVVYDLAVGSVVVVRSVSSHVAGQLAVGFLLAVVAVVTTAFLSRQVLRIGRAR
ncbi:MAG: anti-sigma factor family protein [Pyrinomonadaceae bacterium]